MLRRPRFERGFTLVELLVVVGVVTLLIALLLPVLSSAREQARATMCMSHERQLWQGWLLFAADHENRLPGNLDDYSASDSKATSDPAKWDWLAGWAPRWWDSYDTAPQNGTVFNYVGRNFDVYRCPSLELATPEAFNVGPGAGSNGRFDYVAFTTFAGCRLDHVPPSATFIYSDGTSVVLPTPVICEEDAATLNGAIMEGAHSSSDQMAH
ncbi:MAG TPA: prepilin-type N-terminal cleavage/methylation domain-containing protein, partial [Tepidisphaeraceae bacterium]|nr:prepilin-type N-terminal cleavage/methylation domain-containing protein [Tepidisphaeraceae bacterium]